MKMLIECVVCKSKRFHNNKQISYRASLSWQEIIMIIPWCVLPKESCPVAALA